MKQKVSELEGALLDAAVAMVVSRTSGFSWGPNALDGTLREGVVVLDQAGGQWEPFCPSTNWAIGGPIIEREHIKLAPFSETYWEAVVYDFKRDPDRWPGRGPTPLIAAMRAYVASKLGDEVEIP